MAFFCEAAGVGGGRVLFSRSDNNEERDGRGGGGRRG